MRMPVYVRMFKAATISWKHDKVPRLGAALAYYALFAMAPVLLVVIAIAGLVWGPGAVRGQIVGEIDQLLGRDGARVVQDMLEGAARPRQGWIATVIGSVTFLVAVTGAFIELQHVLNFIWRVKPKKRHAVHLFFVNRLRSFGVVVAIAFLLLISLAASAALTALSSWIGSKAPSISTVWPVIGEVLAFTAIVLLFASMYRLLPDVKLAWRDTWVGSIVTALLFTAGKFLIGFYLGRSATASTYGAAAAVAIILVWVYYATQIVLLGAEYTRIHARWRHIVPRPEPYAKREDAGKTPDKPKRKEAR